MFYDNLLQICKEKNIAVTNLIKEVDLSSGNLSRWKQGGKPRSDTLIKISEKLGISVNYLLGNDKTDAKELWYSRFSALTPENQKVIEDMIKVLENNQFDQE